MRSVVLLGILACGIVGAPLAAQSVEARDSALHALNRLANGARPGELEAVARSGVLRWIEQQLNPAAIADDDIDRIVRRSFLSRYDQRELATSFVETQRRRTALQRQGLSQEEIRREMGPSMGGADLRRVIPELQRLHVARAVLSERQLNEVMVDFWTNHFNVFAAKGWGRFLIVSHVEDVIRPRALGKFEELLIATARSPAMLFYLDNVQSVMAGARPPEIDRAMARAARRGGLSTEQRERLERRLPRGLNENYARELLELHTLGVDGGYTQHDVQEVARVLTGWSISRPQEGAGFRFHTWAHDRGEKTVLGKTFAPGRGEEEGIELLRFLASHPSTRRHLSYKLCERLVADVAPDGCVDTAVRAWRRTDGDIREVVRAIVLSPDFWSPATRSAKTKTPLEFVVSAVRATGARPDSTPRLSNAVRRLGQPLFLESAPTGYPETQEDWVNSGALLNRMNLALAIAARRLPGLSAPVEDPFPAGDVEQLLDGIDASLFGGSLSERTRAVIAAQVAGVDDPRQTRIMVLGLALGGPDFQRQ